MKWMGLVVALAFAAALRPAIAADTSEHDCSDESTTSETRIVACSAMIAAEPDDIMRGHYFELRGTAYFDKNSFVRALADFQQELALDGERAQVHYNIALVLLSLGYFKRAEPEIDSAIDQNIDDPRAFLLRAAVRNRLGRYGDALQDLNIAASDLPDNDAVFSERGYAELENGNARQAIADFDKAIALNPGLADEFYFRGRAHFALDEYDAALDDFRVVMRLAPDRHMDVQIAEVEALRQPVPAPDQDPQNHPARAVANTHSCAGYYPQLSVDLIETGSALIHYDLLADGTISNVGIDRSSGVDRLDRAAVICVSQHWRSTPAVRDGSAVPTPHHQAIIQFKFQFGPTESGQARRAAALAGIGRYTEAVAQYDVLIAAHPDVAEYFFRRGFARYLQGDLQAAAADFKSVIGLKPDYDDAIGARDLLQRAMLNPPEHPAKGI
jgi:TonB family protein